MTVKDLCKFSGISPDEFANLTIGGRIKLLRKFKGMTQDEFAKRAGIKRSALSLIENGINNPSTQTILLICQECNVSENLLRTGQEDNLVSNQEGDFFLDDLVRQKGGTEEDLELVKAYFDLPAEVRQILLKHFKERLLNNSETSSHDYSDIPDRPDTENDENAENSVG